MKRCYVIVLFFILMFAACGPKEKTVAIIGKKKSVTVQELISFYNQRNRQKAANASYSQLKDVLDRMIEDKIKILAAYDMHLDQDSTLLKRVENYRVNLMLGTLHEIKVTDQVVNESLIRDYYNKSSKDVEYQDLFIPMKRSAEPAVKQEKKKKAEMIVKELREGKNFSQLVKEYSQDPDIYVTEKTISYTRINDPFQSEVFSLPLGETSDVIKDYKGYHIVYIKKFHSQDMEPYNQKRDDIKKQLSRQLTVSMQKEAQRYLEKLVQEADITWNDETLKVLYNRLHNIKPRDQLAKTVHDTLMNLSADEKQLNLVILNGKKMTVSHFTDMLSNYNPQLRFAITDTVQLKNKVTEFLQRDLLTEKALSLHLDTHKQVVEKLTQFKESYMIRLLNRQEIFEVQEPDEGEVYNYYAEHKNDTYSHLKDRNFDTIKLQVKRDLQRKLSNEKKNKWLSEKKKEYQIKIFDNVLREIIDEEKI